MPRRLTQEEFIRRAREKHGDKYDYSKVRYVNASTPVTIVCPIHGDFEQIPDSHLQGKGCRRCGVEKAHQLKPFEWFLKRAREVHGDKYDYSQVKWGKVMDKITIICPEHGPFEQTANGHLNSRQGCPKCGLKKLGANKRHSLEEFLRLAKEKHGDKYDYSQVTKYVNGSTPVTIICKTCGQPFEQKPKMHIKGHGCTHCANNKPIGTEEFIRRAKDVWGDRYTYEKTVYTSNKEKVIVTCQIHGDFQTTAYDFLKGHGCPDCGMDAVKQKRRKPQDDFIAQCKSVHGDRYDYSQAVYRGKRQKVTIICRKHGPFEQWPDGHLLGQGCPTCKIEEAAIRNAKGTEKFVEEARKVHGNKYDYSQVVYVNNKTNVTVICPDHGPFEVAPQDHLQGMNGCPKCCTSKGEKRILVWLEAHNIPYLWHKSIRSPLAIGKRKKFIPDFQLPTKDGMFIEYNGEQHYRPKELWGGEKQLRKQQKRDAALREYCRQEEIRLLEIPYTDFDRIEEILERELKA